MRTSLRAGFACAAATLLCLTPTVSTADTPAGRCTTMSFPAPEADGAMGATLCLPATPTNLVMVLIPGSNYNHAYWDFPYQPQTYSFRRAMNAAGYATLVVDRVGTGTSTRPSSIGVNATGESRVLHRIVTALRRGLPGAHPFAKIVIGGHSLSSGIDVLEASTYHDVDGVLLTGYSHSLNMPSALGVMAAFHPAGQDPEFVGRGYDPGYLTTEPGTRESDFYSPADADPRVVAADEATKDVFAATEYPDGLTSVIPPLTNLINVPVMVVNGSVDRLCDPVSCADDANLYATEAPYYSPPARLRVFVLHGSGHAVNLARNTPTYQAAVHNWLQSTVE